MKPQESTSPARRPDSGGLASTNWAALEQGDLDHLAASYFKPVFRFVRSRVYDEDLAEEATQEFFYRFLKRRAFERANREKGKFRSFLFHLVRQFLIDFYRERGAAKRGGGITPAPISEIAELEGDGQQPREEFDRQWFMSLLNAARRELKKRFVESDREPAYRAFRLFHFGSGEPVRWTHKRIAESLGATPTQINNYIHRTRTEYASILRDLIADYTASADELEDELRTIAHFLDTNRIDGPPSTSFMVGRLPLEEDDGEK